MTRRIIGKIHLWVGLALCLPLVIIGLTGSVLVFEDELQGAATGHDALDFHNAFKPAYDKLGVAQTLLGFELDARRALLTNGALQTYSIAKGVARTDVATGIHVRNIKKALKRKSAKAKNPPQQTSADKLVPQLKTSADEPVPQEVPEKT